MNYSAHTPRQVDRLSPAYLVLPCLLAGLYVFAFRFNGFLDLPNHMARAYIMLHCFNGGAAAVCQHFQVSFVPVPFLLADLTLVASLAVFSVGVAEKVAVFFLLVLTIAAWYLLYNELNGSRAAGYLAGLALVLNNFLYNGFYAYVFSVALALLWVRLWWPRRNDKTVGSQLVLSVTLAIIFGFHLAGFLLAFLIYAMYDLHTHLLHRAPDFRRWWNTTLRGAPVYATFVGLYVFQQSVVGRTAAAGGIEYKPLPSKLATILYPFINFSRWLDLALLAAILILLFSAVPRRSVINVVRSFWGFVAAMFFLAFVVLPTSAHGVYDFDVRFLMLAYFALFLAVGRFADAGRRTQLGIVAALAISYGVGLYWKSQYNKELAAVERVLRMVPAEASLAQVNSRRNYPFPQHSRVSPFAHFGTYHILQGGSLVGELFDCRFNQNLAYFCYRDADVADADHFKFQFLGTPAVTAADLDRLGRLYDYVLVTGHSPGDPMLRKYHRQRFQMVAQHQEAALFRTAP